MYDVCEHIAVKANLFPLDISGKQPMVSMAKTAIGICGISKCFCSILPCLVDFWHAYGTY